MLEKIFNKKIFIIFIIFAYLSSINIQLPINSIYDNYCIYNDLYVPNTININEQISEENLNLIVTINLNKTSTF